jgi:ABC-type polysaccharide/polyol phosphate transport system ATPase subunit
MTGRENIYLSSAMFGFTTREIRAAEDEIIAFSELGPFIDVPTKNYSSGCRPGRFAIAFELRPDIFLIDGSGRQRGISGRCLQRLGEIVMPATPSW